MLFVGAAFWGAGGAGVQIFADAGIAKRTMVSEQLPKEVCLCLALISDSRVLQPQNYTVHV